MFIILLQYYAIINDEAFQLFSFEVLSFRNVPCLLLQTSTRRFFYVSNVRIWIRGVHTSSKALRLPDRCSAFVPATISNRIINYKARAAEHIFQHLRPVLRCDRRRMRRRIASGLCLQGGPRAINSSPRESYGCFIIRVLLRHGRDTNLLSLSFSFSFFPSSQTFRQDYHNHSPTRLLAFLMITLR